MRDELERAAAEIRREILDILVEIGPEHRGHPGGCLSIVDLVTALYFGTLTIDPSRPDWPDRDRFILSKGHGCLAVYVALARRGYFDRRHLRTFRSVDSLLQGHPDMRRTPGIDMTSGSLGHGLSVGVGMALDARARRSPTHVYVMLGDGELQEGIVWEGAMAAAKYRLGGLTALVDCNGFQSSGRVDELMPIEPLAAKWRAFGWRALTIDGHNMDQIVWATLVARRSARPTVILCRTVKGKGVAYMEGDNHWHQAWPAARMGENTVATREKDARPSPPSIWHPQGLASTRAAFGATLLDLMRERDDIVVVSADTRTSMGLEAVARHFPDRCIEVGIAEQNLVAVAAGLAAGGRTVFIATYATFASLRALEQIRSVVAYPGLRVVIAAGMGGLTGGIEGVCHLATEDLGILRCVPGLVILNPADAIATAKAVRAAAGHSGPVYIRLGRDDTPVLFDEAYPFTVGKGLVLVDGGPDVVLMTSGLITSEVLDAASKLGRDDLPCTVVEFPTLKPLDRDLVLQASTRARAIFTIEEHSIIGGLGSAVMEVLAHEAPAAVVRIGLPDRFLESGTPAELRAKYGLTAHAIATRVREACRERRVSVLAGEEPGRQRVQHAQHEGGGRDGLRAQKRHARQQHQHHR